MSADAPLLCWLSDPRASDPALVGAKAARLAELLQAGFPVPDGFALTVAADRVLDTTLRDLATEALARLREAHPGPVAVRSSATAEDLEGASLAGLQESVLGVEDHVTLERAIARVRGSLDSPEAEAYRARLALEGSRMAVLVQHQVDAKIAGIAFGRDPISAEPITVVELVSGLGDALARGDAEPERWRLRADGSPVERPEPSLVDVDLVRAVNALVLGSGTRFGAPQDIEWAHDGERLWLLQSRPITSRAEDWFTDHLPRDDHLWTAAFLNERFTQPVSPLGWTVVAAPLERLALRGPLELLGASEIEPPLLKLWRGHPFSRVEGWQRIYKLFPDALLPEDAQRFFPAGDTTLRRAPRDPVLGWHLVRNALNVLRDYQVTSPFHNPRGWARYEALQEAELITLDFRARGLDNAPDPIAEGLAILRRSAELTERLLDLHRWSLLYADLSYSLLRRLLAYRHGDEEAARRAARLTRDIDSPTTRMNNALGALAARLAVPENRARVGGWASERAPLPLERLVEPEERRGDPFVRDVDRFLQQYGHRFLSLDLYDPPWAADVPALARFLLVIERGGGQREVDDTPTVPPWARPLLGLTRAYIALRERQRFTWQRLLALQRAIALRLGALWYAGGELEHAEDIFGVTWHELMSGHPDGERAAARMRRLRRLRAQAAQAPAYHYPPFLRGNSPLVERQEGVMLRGRAVSPGVARGPARLIAHPAELARARAGDILVTSAPDPGWTPIFGTVAGLVTERGGQLSHGAVVAREYRLPAVSGIAGALATIREGEPLLVDGTQGIVLRLNGQPEQASQTNVSRLTT